MSPALTGGLRPVFAGFLYWHLKYLKPGFGFANYDLENNPNSRYARKRERILCGLTVADPRDLPGLATINDRLLVAARRMRLPLGRKPTLIADRWRAVSRLPPLPSLEGVI